MIGVAGAALVASICDLSGNSRTRPFTRRAFLIVVLFEAGVDVELLASVANTMIQVAPI